MYRAHLHAFFTGQSRDAFFDSPYARLSGSRELDEPEHAPLSCVAALAGHACSFCAHDLPAGFIATQAGEWHPARCRTVRQRALPPCPLSLLSCASNENGRSIGTAGDTQKKPPSSGERLRMGKRAWGWTLSWLRPYLCACGLSLRTHTEAIVLWPDVAEIVDTATTRPSSSATSSAPGSLCVCVAPLDITRPLRVCRPPTTI